MGGRVAGAITVLQLFGLLAAAYLDQSLWLSGDGVGLFEHPGMLAIVVGDLLLMVLSIQASRLTLKVGRKLPSNQQRLVRRYFRVVVLRRIFGSNGQFFQMLLMLSLIGAIALVNQSIRLTDADIYYGHDTFDSVRHPWSFWVNRINLGTSWCLVVPLFASYLFAHTLAVRQLFRKCDQHGLIDFQPGHPDRSGGFAFFGWLDTLYVGGLIVVLIEVVLLVATHRRMTIGSMAGVLAVTLGSILISLLSIYEVVRVVKRQEKVLKAASVARRLRRPGRLTVDYVTLIYSTSFSPYTPAALRIAIALRLAAAVPAILRIAQYVAVTVRP